MGYNAVADTTGLSCVFTELAVTPVSRSYYGYAYACVRLSVCLSVCLSSVVCNVCIVAKRCVLPTNCLKKQIGHCLWGIE